MLFLLVCDLYGRDVLPDDENQENPSGWHPETIQAMLERDFDVKLPKLALDKIMAAITIVTTDYFLQDEERFVELCNVLSGDDFQPDEFEPADAREIIWAVTESLILWPPEEHEPFSDAVRGYIGQVLQEEGISSPPDVLRLGLGGANFDQVPVDLADDPEMYRAVYDVQQGKRTELTETLLDSLQELIFQLRLLPLQNGSRDGLLAAIEHLAAKLPEPPTQPPPQEFV